MKPAYAVWSARDAKPHLRTKNFPFGASTSNPTNTQLQPTMFKPRVLAPLRALERSLPPQSARHSALQTALHLSRTLSAPTFPKTTLHPPLSHAPPILTNPIRLTRLPRNSQPTLPRSGRKASGSQALRRRVRRSGMHHLQTARIEMVPRRELRNGP